MFPNQEIGTNLDIDRKRIRSDARSQYLAKIFYQIFPNDDLLCVAGVLQ